MKIASWNVNSLKVRLPQVLEWCEQEQPDVLALQETKLTDENFPVSEIEEAGYQVAFSGQKTYNGVAVLARDSISDVITDIPGLEDEQRRILAVTVGDLRIVNLYVVNGKEVGSDKYDYKLHWLDKVTEYLADQVAGNPLTVVLGDFNIAPDDRDVYDPKRWHEKILCSTPERDALFRIMDLGFDDSFRIHHEDGGIFSWWDYRMGGFQRGLGLRIDLILTSHELSPQCTSAYVDPVPRQWERPSDHTPVVAELDV
ncbi:MAG: exodeoxyribonuclease III [Xanthomonadales bacterium]|nr:exodeoxyribonuclease III [Xanthomonadales bacterium]